MLPGEGAAMGFPDSLDGNPVAMPQRGDIGRQPGAGVLGMGHAPRPSPGQQAERPANAARKLQVARPVISLKDGPNPSFCVTSHGKTCYRSSVCLVMDTRLPGGRWRAPGGHHTGTHATILASRLPAARSMAAMISSRRQRVALPILMGPGKVPSFTRRHQVARETPSIAAPAWSESKIAGSFGIFILGPLIDCAATLGRLAMPR